MHCRYLLAVLAAAALSGCSSLLGPTLGKQEPALSDARMHLLYIDEDGDLQDPKTKRKVHETVTASPDAEAAMVQADSPGTAATSVRKSQQALWNRRRMEQARELTYVRAMIGHYLSLRTADGRLPKPVLHIHGGLNDHATVLERAEKMPPYMLSEGHYPFFIGWPSDFWFSLKEHVAKSDRGRERSLAGSLFFGAFQALEDLARSVIRIPTSVVRQIDNALKVPLANYSGEERDAEGRAGLLTDAGFTVVSEGPFRGVGSSYATIANPVGWLVTPLRDGFGPGAWNSMLRQTELVLTKAAVYEGAVYPANTLRRPEQDQLIGASAADPSDTAVRLFLREWQANEVTSRQPITLVGHSMGAIVALNVLSRHPEIDFDQVVFMAAAARIKHVESVLIPWLKEHPRAQFYNLSLDPYNEIAERTYFDFAPRGSLLMWIEDSFGEVNSFRDRTVGKWWNAVRIAEDLFPPQVGGVPIRARVTLKRFPIVRDGTLGPQSHGAFNLYCWWREDFWAGAEAARPLFVESTSTQFARPLETCLTASAGRNVRDDLTYRPKEAAIPR